MKNTLKHRIWFWNLIRQKQILVNRKPVNYNFPVTRDTRFMICMPSRDSEFYLARDMIKSLSRDYPHIILVTRPENDLSAEHKGQVLHYPVTDKDAVTVKEENFQGFPKKVDIALDLSSSPHIVSAYLTATRGKDLTIGFRSKYFDKFYTLNLKQSGNYGAMLETVFSFLGMI